MHLLYTGINRTEHTPLYGWPPVKISHMVMPNAYTALDMGMGTW